MVSFLAQIPQGTPQSLELLRKGDPVQALAALEKEIQSDPGNFRSRVFIFQLLCVLGNWKRALAQLRMAAELDPETRMMATAFRNLILSEIFRDQVFSGLKTPFILGKPEPWIARMIQALQLEASGSFPEALALRTEALEMAEPCSGTLNDKPFAWISDADPRLGPLLEVIIHEGYHWIPLNSIKLLTFQTPSDLRDRVWAPVTLRLLNDGELTGYIPVRYPGTLASGNIAAMMSRVTEWHDQQGTWQGIGQKVLTTDQDEMALLDIRTLAMDCGGAH